MDTLLVVLLVSLAVAFTTELLEFAFAQVPIVNQFINSVLTLPIAVLYHYILGTEYPMIVVASAATSFLALTWGIVVEKISTTYTEVRRGRR